MSTMPRPELADLIRSQKCDMATQLVAAGETHMIEHVHPKEPDTNKDTYEH